MNRGHGWRGPPRMLVPRVSPLPSPVLLALAAIAFGAIALAGCGQTGPLTLPGAAGQNAGDAQSEQQSQNEDDAENEDSEQQ